MKKEAVIINISVNGEAYTVSYESGVTRTYKKVTKPIAAWLENHAEAAEEADQATEEAHEGPTLGTEVLTLGTEVPTLGTEVPTLGTEEVHEEVHEEAPEEAPEEASEEIPEETSLVPTEPAEPAAVEEDPAEDAFDQAGAGQDPEGPAFGWKEAAGTAKAAFKAIAAACRTAAPAAKAGCTILWNLARLVIMALISLVKTVRLYGPDVIAEAKADAIVAYYKARTFYFRSVRIARALAKASKKAAKASRRIARAAKLGTWKAIGSAADAGRLVIAPMLAAFLVAAMVAVKGAARMAGCAKDGWELRESIIREEEGA